MSLPDANVVDVPRLSVCSADAAKIIGVSPKTLRNWRAAGIGPRFIRLRDDSHAPCLYLVEDIRDWLHAQKRY